MCLSSLLHALTWTWTRDLQNSFNQSKMRIKTSKNLKKVANITFKNSENEFMYGMNWEFVILTALQAVLNFGLHCLETFTERSWLILQHWKSDFIGKKGTFFGYHCIFSSSPVNTEAKSKIIFGFCFCIAVFILSPKLEFQVPKCIQFEDPVTFYHSPSFILQLLSRT